jgi:hypothetical protein
MSTQPDAPTQQHAIQVIEILHFNGIQVGNTKASYEQLKQFEADPSFAMVLAHIFNADTPVAGSIAAQQGAVGWLHYRRLAGITLKNNVERAKTLLGETAVIAVAKSCIHELRQATHPSLVTIAAQIAVKITSIVGLDWWDSASLCNLPSFLLNELLGAAAETAVLGGLYSLQYLLEDVPKQLGNASEVIVQRVAQMVIDENRPETIRRAAFRVASHPYELGSLLDWNVESLSPMQQGLCNASSSFAQCCTALLAASQHITFASLVLRSTTLMFDYLEYFLTNDAGSAHLVATWVGAALQHTLHPSNADVAASAADFFAYLFEVYERTGGEGPIQSLASASIQAFPSLIPVLFKYIALTQEEEQAILEKDHFSHRDAYAVVMQVSSSSGGRLEDNADNDGVDDDEGTLRKSAASCLDKLCTIAPNEAAPLILAEIGATWTHADWRVREASLLGFGSSVRGCFAAMASHLPNIVGNLKTVIGDSSAHVCVVSMAMWCIQRVVTWLVSAEGQPFVTDLVHGIVVRLESDSKRVQASAVTALKVILQAIGEVQLQLPSALVEDAVRRVHRCIESRYNTGNLSSLCDVSLLLLGLLPDSMVVAFASPFFGVRTAKMACFEQSYSAALIEHQPNVLVDKDVMYIDRVLVAVLERSPSTEQHTAILSTWAGVLWDVAQRSAYDDADLVFHSIFNASQYVRSFDSASLTAWLAHRNYDVVKATLQILEHHKPANSFIRCSCYVMLYQLINIARESCLGDEWTLATCYRCSTTMLTDDVDDDPALLSAISNLLSLLIMLRPEQRSLDAVLLLSQKLRGDVFGDSYAHHFAVSCSLCKVVRAHPSLAGQLPLAVIATIFAAAPNTLSKSMATIDLCTAIQAALSDAAPAVVHAVCPCIPSLLRMVFSWQQAATGFGNGTFEAIGSVLRALLHHGELSAAAGQVIQALPEGYRSQFLGTYGLA